MDENTLKTVQFLFMVKINGENHLLHDGNTFIGASRVDLMPILAIEHSAKIVSVGGYKILKISVGDLVQAIGANERGEYPILNANGGLLPFYVVKIADNTFGEIVEYIPQEN
jgi:hypothetical protein